MSEPAKKRVQVVGSKIEPVVAALAGAAGVELVPVDVEQDVDLLVAELASPAELASVLAGRDLPVLAIAPRRLRAWDSRALIEAGATLVIDAEASLLDVAFAFSSLLFETSSAHRRCCRQAGGLPVRFGPAGADSDQTGKMIGIARSGGYIQTDAFIPEGTVIQMVVDIANKSASIRGRVAYTTAECLGVEFALGDHDVAPSLVALAVGAGA